MCVCIRPQLVRYCYYPLQDPFEYMPCRQLKGYVLLALNNHDSHVPDTADLKVKEPSNARSRSSILPATTQVGFTGVNT